MDQSKKSTTQTDQSASDNVANKNPQPQNIKQPSGEIGGSQGQEPTTFGDWQHAGRCSDF